MQRTSQKGCCQGRTESSYTATPSWQGSHFYHKETTKLMFEELGVCFTFHWQGVTVSLETKHFILKQLGNLKLICLWSPTELEYPGMLNSFPGTFIVLLALLQHRERITELPVRDPQHRELRALLFSNSVWVLLRLAELWTSKRCEIGPTVYRPYPSRLKFYSLIQWPWVLVRPGYEPPTSPHGGASLNRLNQPVFTTEFWRGKMRGFGDDADYNECLVKL